ncbi:MAG: ATP-binding cassette domain-containing protein, partial [Pirellulales bacterium]|nr:ATP-binding cassette domain-containing protein [Pirellulales bacterium]
MLEVSNLSVIYESAEVHGLVRAVRDVSFSVSRGECVGLVGESGCGKSSVANAIVGLVPATGGDIRLAESRAGDDDGVRARRVQLVFQDPFGSLNPRMKLGNVLDEVLRVHGVVGDDRSHDERIRELFAMVELDPKLASRFPHELSGGQRQ